MEVYFLKRAIADQLREAEFWCEQDPNLSSEFLKELDKESLLHQTALSGHPNLTS